MSVLGDIGPRSTPQTEPVPGKQMVANNAGGYTFALDDWARLGRFLVLGVDAGTYYVGARELALDNAQVVSRCLNADHKRTIDLAVEVSVQGRAPQNDPAIFVLAVAAAHPQASGYALARLAEVCRIGTHLFHFARFVEGQRGWGRALRRAVGAWYSAKTVDDLAYQLVKYRQRDGWSHRDLLRLAHPEPPSAEHNALYRFVTQADAGELPRIIEGYLKAQASSDPDETAELVREYRLPWETLTSDHLASPKVWGALLDSGALPLGALVRNLGVLTTRGVVANGSKGTTTVVDRLADVDAIRKARLHPVAILNALITYAQGQGMRGQLAWTPVSRIVDALDAAFYASFGTVDPAGKRTLLAIDISGSMTWSPVTGAVFDSRAGAGAMAMVTAASEPQTIVTAFSHGTYRTRGGYGSGITPVDVSPRRRLDDNLRAINSLPAGGTDCALPMLWAAENQVEVDTVVVYTDNETWAGAVHPFQALRQYRDRTGIPARLIVVGMTSTGFTIADPTDPGMLDVVGFDTAAPSVMTEFSAGRF